MQQEVIQSNQSATQSNELVSKYRVDTSSNKNKLLTKWKNQLLNHD